LVLARNMPPSLESRTSYSEVGLNIIDAAPEWDRQRPHRSPK
jgi:hypothetical protein